MLPSSRCQYANIAAIRVLKSLYKTFLSFIKRSSIRGGTIQIGMNQEARHDRSVQLTLG
jgi:hypothetical protein